MATDLRQTRTAKAAGAKNDVFVQSQLGRAERRIRTLDIAAALLGFAALLCVAVAAAALADSTWSLPAWARQVCFAAIALVGGVYLIFTLGRPLLYRVNPYYAAKIVEQTMPGAKNSVVSWLDLQQEDVAPAIRAAVGQKAAKDLQKADIDRAFSGRRVLWVGVVAAVCAGIFIACFVRAGSEPFFRVMAPFSFGSGEANTSITLTRPANGDELITMGTAVVITARVSGKVPDPNSPQAIRVLYRYQEGDPYKSPLWMQPDTSGAYTATVQPIDVSEGFFYKVVAGDAETPEYRISVRGRPLLTKVQATYHFRPYTGRDDEHHFAGRTFPIEVLRGTEITLVARTNRAVQSAALVLEDSDGKRHSIDAEKVENDAFAFRVKHVVEQSTRYHLEYTTPEGETYKDPNPPQLVAKVDEPPKPVDLAAPRETQLPCNGILQVEGVAGDDIGVKSMTLRMREVTRKFELEGKPYRSDAELRLRSGGYPLKLAYKDFVDLNTVQTPDKKLLALQEGMKLEYWLEASDACDYPKPGVTESKHYFVTLMAPEKNQQKLDEQRNKAQQEQREHEKNQDNTLRKEDQQRLMDKAQQKNERDEDKAQQGEQKHGDKSGDPSAKDEDTKKKAADLQKKIDQENERQKKKSESKDGPQDKPASAKDNGAQEKQQPGEAKPQGQPESSQKPGESKPEPQHDPQSPPSQTKPDAQPSQQPSESKADTSPNGTPKSEPKENAAQKPQPPAESKSAPPPENRKESSKPKPDPQPSNQECKKGECKNGGKSDNPNNPNSVPKPDESPVHNNTEGKNAGGSHPKPEAKPGGKPDASSKGPPTQGDDNVPAADEKNNPSGGPSDPRKATSKNVANDAEGLKSDDANERQRAAKELEEIADKAQDEKVRKQAKEELEEAGLKPGKAKAQPQKPEDQSTKKDSKADVKPSDAKDGKGDPDKRSAPKDLAEPKLLDKPPELTDPEEKQELAKRQEEYLQMLKESMKREGKFDEEKFRELERNRDRLDPPALAARKGDNEDAGKEIEKREKREQRATTLQLRKILEAVDPKVLKDAGITEEQYREFLKNYADKIVRDEQKKETLPPSQRGKMGSIGGTRENPGAKADPTTPSGPSRAKAPPGYEEPLKNLQRDLNSTSDKK
jgi:hypothetical protein